MMDPNHSARGFWTRVDQGEGKLHRHHDNAPGSLTLPSYCRATDWASPCTAHFLSGEVEESSSPCWALAPFTLRQSTLIIRSDGLFLERGMADSSLLGPPRTTSPPRMARDALTGCPTFYWGLRPIIQARDRNTRHNLRQGGDPFPWKSKLPGDDTVPQSRRSGNGLGYTKAGCFFLSSSATELHYIISNPSHHSPFFLSCAIHSSFSIPYL